MMIAYTGAYGDRTENVLDLGTGILGVERYVIFLCIGGIQSCQEQFDTNFKALLHLGGALYQGCHIQGSSVYHLKEWHTSCNLNSI